MKYILLLFFIIVQLGATGQTGSVKVSQGGTGANTAQRARINILPPMTGNSLKVLRVNTGETDYELATVSSGSGSGLLHFVAGNGLVQINDSTARLDTSWSDGALTLKMAKKKFDSTSVLYGHLASANTWALDQTVPDEAYDATAWDGSLEVPTKNAIRDKIESISTNIIPTLEATTFTTTPTANGISMVNDSTIRLHAADGSNPGGVSTGAQHFAGTKFFDNYSQFESGLSIKKATIGSSSPSGYLWLYGGTSDGYIYTRDEAGLETKLSNDVKSLKVNTTDVGNVGAGEDDLMTYSVPASTLVTNGDYIEFTMTIKFAANANNKTVKLYYGSTNFYNSGAQAQNDGTMEITGRVIRTGAATQRISFSVNSNTSLFSDYADYTTATETLSGAVTLKATGTGTSNDDIIQKILTVKYIIGN